MFIHQFKLQVGLGGNPHRTMLPVISDTQRMVVNILDGGQSAAVTAHFKGIKMLPGSNHNLLVTAQKSRRARHPVGHGRKLFCRSGETGQLAFAVPPDDFIPIHSQLMRKRMRPAVTQPDVGFNSAGPIKPLPLKRQQTNQMAVGQLKQFFTGCHGNRVIVTDSCLVTLC
ncbi:hypothetical protein VIM7927_04401 [Vibrio mangrovi]|uniref:Uncharacterized protein n=1 Tax=Vibrio mangrovi TaxID=474394 RepID=A0A1Y6IZI1_9VIBR|nr:hypothetical protein VIM7927_04401 [Vibrio mangrovi]